MPTIAAKHVPAGAGRLDAFSWATVAAVVATFSLLVAGSLASAHGHPPGMAAPAPALAIASPRP